MNTALGKMFNHWQVKSVTLIILPETFLNHWILVFKWMLFLFVPEQADPPPPSTGSSLTQQDNVLEWVLSQKHLRIGLSYKTKSSSCWPGIQIPQILIGWSICLYLTYESGLSWYPSIHPLIFLHLSNSRLGRWWLESVPTTIGTNHQSVYCIYFIFCL